MAGDLTQVQPSAFLPAHLPALQSWNHVPALSQYVQESPGFEQESPTEGGWSGQPVCTPTQYQKGSAPHAA